MGFSVVCGSSGHPAFISACYSVLSNQMRVQLAHQPVRSTGHTLLCSLEAVNYTAVVVDARNA